MAHTTPYLIVLMANLCLGLFPSTVFSQHEEDPGKQAFEHAQMGEYTEALLLYEKAISITDKNANYFYYKGVCHFELHQYQEAVVAFTSAIGIHSRRADYFSNRGKAYLRLEQFAEAIEDFSRAIQLDPLQGEFYYLRATAKSGLKIYPEALKDYDIAIGKDSRVGEYFLGRGECYLAMGQAALACENFHQAVTKHAFNAKYQYETHCLKTHSPKP